MFRAAARRAMETITAVTPVKITKAKQTVVVAIRSVMRALSNGVKWERLMS